MMPTNQLLTANQVVELGIVVPSSTKGIRPTTIDATIGEIITKKGLSKEHTVNIPPRGIAWIMSKERFKLPNSVTGITTLRTRWTRKGILTLTVGIVDPGYDGHLSTAVINFGKCDFPLIKGEPFFRTAFFAHEEVIGIDRVETEEQYRNSVIQDSATFSDNFLTMDTLADELAPKILALPRWGLIIALVGTLIALLGLVLPPAFGLIQEVARKNAEIELLDQRVAELSTRLKVLENASEDGMGVVEETEPAKMPTPLKPQE